MAASLHGMEDVNAIMVYLGPNIRTIKSTKIRKVVCMHYSKPRLRDLPDDKAALIAQYIGNCDKGYGEGSFGDCHYMGMLAD